MQAIFSEELQRFQTFVAPRKISLALTTICLHMNRKATNYIQGHTQGYWCCAIGYIYDSFFIKFKDSGFSHDTTFAILYQFPIRT